jgi:hypothetical protein
MFAREEEAPSTGLLLCQRSNYSHIMNYYETKQLQDRESRTIAAGVSLILFAPAFGIAAGAFLLSALALYLVTVLFVILGIFGIVQGIKEKIDRKKNINN